ncbi:MAG TPA: AAA family ATPase, partial [Bryobacteraceae bacterium]|nr:AAA family ATPase [Bryobacteraceae bacterium]
WREIRHQVEEHESSADTEFTRLTHSYSLTRHEYWLVLLCAAVERYPEAAVSIGIMMDEQHVHLMTPMSFAQLLHAACGVTLDEALCVALGGGTAARLGLLEVADAPQGRPLSHQPLRITPAELRALLAHGSRTDRVLSLEAQVEPAYDHTLLQVASNLLEQCRMISLRGAPPRALNQFAHDLAAHLRVEFRYVPVGDGPLNLTSALRMGDVLPIVDLAGSTQTSRQLRTALLDARTTLRRVVVLAPEGFSDSEIPSISVPRLDWVEAERIWRAASGDAVAARTLASRFRVSHAEAVLACRHADQIASARPWITEPRKRERLIAEQVLEEGSRRMGRLVTHLRSRATLADLVVPENLRTQLHDILNWQRHTSRVFGEMGLGKQTPLGRGLTCLFSGPPGTGKTFAAQCIANELGLNLYRIDLSQVVSKYIGETEKALATVFDEADAGHGVLLFDECDALFGKRSEVKDAHDRYANIEVGYLLQRIETYDGVAILATNLRSNMDPAFVRRIRFMLDFPMPDTAMRRQLWEQSLPGKDYRDPALDLDVFVERFRVSGGSIQNISLAAAHSAAATPDGRITMRHLVRATYRELEKSGQSRERSAFGPLADLLPAEVA